METAKFFLFYCIEKKHGFDFTERKNKKDRNNLKINQRSFLDTLK